MRKRLFTYILAAALLLTLIPFGAVRAEAASDFVASAELVEVIKKWEGFCAKPVWDYGQWSVGYGTRAPDEHLARYRAEGISEEEATQLLMGYMESMGKSVNSFIDKFGLNATQGQFDAMVSLTYNCGSRWMLETSTLRTSIIDGWTGNDFVFAWGQWSTAGGVTLPGLVRRRLAEANMFLNGQYSSTPPSDFCYTYFNANGGTGDVVTQAFVAGDPVDIRATATYEGCVFQGWYTDPTGGDKIEKLDSSLTGYTLYAHWGAGEGADQPQDTPAQTITGTPVNYSKQVVSATLNAFTQPVKGAMVVDAFIQHDIVDIVAEYTDASGIKWGKVKNVGWINLTYTQDPSDDTQQDGVTIKVIGNDVNIRRGPGTTYASVGRVNAGTELVITQTKTGGGYTWGRCSKGWIALKFTNYDDAVNDNIDQDNSNTETTPAKQMGTVRVDDFLRIRTQPGVANAVVGVLTGGTRVEILEQKAVGGMIWGRIDKGWISLDYVVLDKAQTQQPEETKPEETTPPTTTAPEETKPTEPPKQETPAVTGKVKLTSGRLNVRSGPSTGYSVVSSYANGTAVTILEQKTVGTVTWGRTDKGWISLDYVKLDTAQTEKPEETQPEETTPPTTTPEETTPEEKPEEKPTQATSETGTVSLTSGCLRVRSGPGTGYSIVDNLYNGAKVTITERKTVGTSQWGKTAKGWVCLDYVKFGSTNTGNTTTGNQNNNTGSDSSTSENLTGSVNVSDFLRVRSGAGTNYSVVGYYYKNNKVTITEQKTVGGTKWGKTDKGWICLDYVILDGQSAPSTESKGTAGTVTGTGLRIRSGAGTNHAIVGSLTIGDKVTILETTTVGNTKWGRIQKGWVCLDYVKLN